MLLDGVNHIAWISKDVAQLGRFYAEVFDADVGPSRPHGENPGETMTVIRIGPHLAQHCDDRGRGRIDHFGLQATSPDAFEATHRPRRQRRHH